MSTSANDTSTNKGQLGLWDAISIIVGIVIGTMIFVLPWLVFKNASDPYAGLLVWVLGGLLALIGAFCYAELATTYPKAGGDYYYLSKAFGSGTGFLFGWAQLVVVMPASIGTMAYAFAQYALEAFHDPKGGELLFEVEIGQNVWKFDPYFAICCYVVLGLTLLNLLGVVLGKTAQKLLALAKILGLVGIIIGGFGWPADNAWDYPVRAVVDNQAMPTFGWLSLSMILVMFAYGGWNDAAFVAAEVRNPQRNIPRALLLGVGLIVLIYLLVNAAYIQGLGFNTLLEFTNAPARVIDNTPLKEYGGGRIMRILVMISALGAANGLIFTYSRIYATLGADHKLFGWLGYWKPGRGSPIMALLLQAAVTVFIIGAITTERGHNTINDALNLINDGLKPVNEAIAKIDPDRSLPPISFERKWQVGDGFEALLSHTAPIFWLFFMMTGFSLFVLREKNAGTPRPYSVPLYPVVPLIFINSCGWMLYQATTYIGWHCLFAVVLALLGLPLFWLSRLMFGQREEEVVPSPAMPRAAAPPPPQQPAPRPPLKPW